ncbi:double zinc ribbon domain-containing protein [Anaerovibrio sp.]|uniref:double zinc ribbon domain-containing protein n=1 Tax=Anaerovibrio sp. TaxID=1872532 RepID=UPI003F139725
MAESKIFKLKDGITDKDIASCVERFLSVEKELYAETVQTGEGYLVQAKESDSWKKFTGMSKATQVQIYPAADGVMVNIGAGKWIDKAGAATVGMLVFAPLAITAAIGAWGQKKLPEEIFNAIEKFIVNGGTSCILNMSTKPAVKDSEILCPECHVANDKNAKFCVGCGAKLVNCCPKCGSQISMGIKFCPECGEKMETEKHCPNCNVVVTVGQKFCLECGTKL